MTHIVVIRGGGCWSTYEKYIESLTAREFTIERLTATDWKDSLAENIPGVTVVTPEMPNRQNARYQEWSIVFDTISKLFPDGTVLVGHSLGAVFLAKYMATNVLPFKPASVHLVAPPFDCEGSVEELIEEFVPPTDLSRLEEQSGKLYLYQSSDDVVVTMKDFEKYIQHLSSPIIRTFTDRGHFKQKEFPELVDDIRAAIRIA